MRDRDIIEGRPIERIRESELRESLYLIEGRENRETRIAETAQVARAQGKFIAFLSHAHDDADLAVAVKEKFRQWGIDLYIDTQDENLADMKVSGVAEVLRKKIRRADILIYLATEESGESRWCPWEIGVADYRQMGNRVYVFSLLDDLNDIQGLEYLYMYPEIGADWKGRPYAVDWKSGKWMRLTKSNIKRLRNWNP